MNGKLNLFDRKMTAQRPSCNQMIAVVAGFQRREFSRVTSYLKDLS